MKQCRACHNAAERRRRAGLRNRSNHRTLATHLTILKNQRTQRQIATACSEMLQAFGGLNGFLDQWRVSIERDLKAGGYAAFRHLESVIRLVQFCDHMQPARPDYSQMTDKELADLVDALSVE